MATGFSAQSITFPDRDRARPPRLAPPVPAAWRPAIASHGSARPTRILMVGDDPAMKQTVASFFEAHGMRVVPVSGRQGVASQLAADPRAS